MFCVVSNKITSAFILLCALSFAGCAVSPSPEILPSAAERLVAKDFAQIVSQVERYTPQQTTFLVPKPIGPVSPFDIALREELTIAGYAIEVLTFTADVSDPVISHRVERSTLNDGELRTYTFSINNVSFRRGYAIDHGGQIRPTTTMQAKGIESNVLRQDDSIFGSEFNLPANNSGSNPTVIAGDTTALSVPVPIGEELIVIPPIVDASSGSDEESVLKGTRIVDESLLVFNGESLVLGEANKRRVISVVNNYNSDSDVFSLLGCVRSEDLEWTEEANELVLGRTERVRSELRYAGIPDDKIKTEECGFGFGAQAPDLPADSLLLLLNRSEP